MFFMVSVMHFEVIENSDPRISAHAMPTVAKTLTPAPQEDWVGTTDISEVKAAERNQRLDTAAACPEPPRGISRPRSSAPETTARRRQVTGAIATEKER